MLNTSVEGEIFAIIAGTFGVDVASIDRFTVPEDVDGWDSLAHTILMMRLEKALGVSIHERIASTAHNVGDLIDGIALCCAPNGRQAVV